MKSLITTSLLLISIGVFSQTELVLQPNSEEGMDARIQSNIPDQNISSSQLFASQSGTINGDPFIDRGLLSFDVVTSIPENSLITSATLSLFANTVNGGHTQIDGSNESVIELITESWDDETVTWNNQPATDSTISVTLPASQNSDDDYINIDVSTLIDEMIENPNQAFGFMIKLVEETDRRSLQFGSSDAPDTSLRPLLRIVYLEPDDCIEANSTNMDARIQSNIPGQNISSSQLFASQSGSISGQQFIDRSLIDFDISQIPTNAIITSARLNLYANTVNGGHTQIDGSNESIIVQITESWNENSVTWINQPSVDENFSVVLEESVSSDQDYLNINVRSIVENMKDNPSNAHGMMIRLTDESGRRSMQFASSNAPDSELHPSLNICYKTTTSVDEELAIQSNIKIYPNPANTHFIIEMKEAKTGKAIILNQNGQLISQFDLVNKITNYNIEDLHSGTYFISITNDKNTITQKIVKI